MTKTMAVTKSKGKRRYHTDFYYIGTARHIYYASVQSSHIINEKKEVWAVNEKVQHRIYGSEDLALQNVYL